MSSNAYTLFSKANCPQCVVLKSKLQQQNVDYNEVDVGSDKEALAFLKGQGHRSVPQLYLGASCITNQFKGE